jgi:hypothetical protein
MIATTGMREMVGRVFSMRFCRESAGVDIPIRVITASTGLWIIDMPRLRVGILFHLPPVLDLPFLPFERKG